MSVRILTGADVAELLPMAECIDVMAEALTTTAKGDAVLPLRSMVWIPDRRGLLGLMPAYLGAPAAIGLKAVSVFPGNHGTDYESHQGAVLLFEIEHGSLVAVMDASAITTIRTAAVSGLATRLLARDDAGDLAILGSGVQAGSHLDAMRAVRPLRRVRVWSRSSENARELAARAAQQHGIKVEPMATPEDAVHGADLVCTTTAAREPVLEGRWIAPGAHINAVGACFANARELDATAVKRARLFVDRRESALAEAGDFLLARAEGAISDDHILGELGDLLLKRVPGRTSPADVTLFESLGIAIEDVAAAHHIHHKAVKLDRGIAVELGGRRAYA